MWMALEINQTPVLRNVFQLRNGNSFKILAGMLALIRIIILDTNMQNEKEYFYVI